MHRERQPSGNRKIRLLRNGWIRRQSLLGEKWHSKFIAQTREATEALVQIARIAQGLSVLDIASGTGEPAITLAEAVGPGGHVVATDLARGMLEVAEENAHTAGVTNISFQQADAHSLPFADVTFDRITCRFGAMYFVDVSQTLSEMRRC